MTVPPAVESRIADAPLSAHVATAVDDRPHVAPVWYGYRDDTLYFTTGGRKLANLRRNPRVAVSIERARGGDVDWNVTLLGTASVVDDPDRIEWASDWIYDAYKEDTETEEDDVADGTSGSTGDESSGDDGSPGGEYALVEVAVGSVSWYSYE